MSVMMLKLIPMSPFNFWKNENIDLWSLSMIFICHLGALDSLGCFRRAAHTQSAKEIFPLVEIVLLKVSVTNNSHLAALNPLGCYRSAVNHSQCKGNRFHLNSTKTVLLGSFDPSGMLQESCQSLEMLSSGWTISKTLPQLSNVHMKRKGLQPVAKV